MITREKILSFLLLAPLILHYPQSSAAASDSEKTKKKLEEVQHKIKKLEKNLYHSRHQEKSLTQDLAKTEKDIGEYSEKMRTFSSKNSALNDKLTHLQKERTILGQQCASQQTAVLQLMQYNLQHDKKEKLQLLLSQNNFSSLARTDQYYQYFYAAKSKKIASLQKQLDNIVLLQHQITHTQQQTKILQEKWESEKKQLESQKIKRTQILTQLSKQLQKDQTELSQLAEQEKHLESLVQTLEHKLKAIPLLGNSSFAFAKMKKQLTFPLSDSHAKIGVHPLLSSKQNKKSYIHAKTDTPVVAIASGRVVFSEWLRGIGLLLIVDHGNGYMSLYGNNQKLYKSLGDSVKQGEMIARVGQSGGHAEPGLYFEIRKDGKALDPSPWFG